MSGKIVLNLLASIDFPEPGSPIRNTLCPPAAAISKALFAISCPFTSEKSMDSSGFLSFSIFEVFISTAFLHKVSTSVFPSRKSRSSLISSTGIISAPEISFASL